MKNVNLNLDLKHFLLLQWTNVNNLSITWQKCRHPAPSLAVIKTFRRYGDYKLVLNPYHFQLIVALDLNTNLVPSTSVSQPVSTGILDFHFLRCDGKSDLVLLFSDSQLLRNHSSPLLDKMCLVPLEMQQFQNSEGFRFQASIFLGKPSK